MSGTPSIASRNGSVLVVVDLQDALASVMRRREEVVRRAALLIEAAAIVGVPIVVTRQYPKGLGDLCAEVEAVLSGVTGAVPVARADKLAFDCFAEQGFVDAIERSGRRQVIVCGMESHICVTQTALSAVARGYEVHVVDDACCAQEDRAHETAMRRMQVAGVAVTTAESVAYELVGVAGTPEFKQLLAAVKRY